MTTVQQVVHVRLEAAKHEATGRDAAQRRGLDLSEKDGLDSGGPAS